jgi:hypothetical protein
VDGRKQYQGPTTGGHAKTAAARMAIVQHPAFRLGFLDALADRPHDHDDIIGRIYSETPLSSLDRLGWKGERLDRVSGLTSIAQQRYEEGRRLVKEYKLKCRAWGYPDYPPTQVVSFCVSCQPD